MGCSVSAPGVSMSHEGHMSQEGHFSSTNPLEGGFDALPGPLASVDTARNRSITRSEDGEGSLAPNTPAVLSPAQTARGMSFPSSLATPSPAPSDRVPDTSWLMSRSGATGETLADMMAAIGVAARSPVATGAAPPADLAATASSFTGTLGTTGTADRAATDASTLGASADVAATASSFSGTLGTTGAADDQPSVDRDA